MATVTVCTMDAPLALQLEIREGNPGSQLRHRTTSVDSMGSPRKSNRKPRMSERYGMDGYWASMISYKTAKFHVVEDPVLALIFRGLQFSCAAGKTAAGSFIDRSTG